MFSSRDQGLNSSFIWRHWKNHFNILFVRKRE